MEAHVNPSSPVEQLCEQLRQAHPSVELTDNGSSHQTSRKYTIVVVAKHQRLGLLFSQPDLTILDMQTKRTGANVKTIISVKSLTA